MQQTEIKTTPGSGFHYGRLSYFVETFVKGSTFVLCMNSSAKNHTTQSLKMVALIGAGNFT